MKQIRSIVIGIMAVMCFSCASKDGGQGMFWQVSPEKRLYDAAESSYQSGQYDAALSRFQSYLAEYPGTRLAPAARLRVGMIHSAKRQYDKAEKELQRVIADYPGTPHAGQARLELLHVWHQTGAYRQITMTAGNALDQPLNPRQRYRANLIIGDAYLSLNSPRDAYHVYLTAFQTATDQQRDAVLPKLKAAVARMDAASLAEELKFLAGRPPADLLIFQLGVQYMEAGKADAAAAVLSDFVERYPFHEKAEQAKQMIAELAVPVSPEGPAIVIGCLLPMTGKYETFGQQAYNGVEFALSQYARNPEGNAVNLLLKDTASDPDKTRQAVRELAESHAAAIIGPIGTVDEAAVSANEAGIPIVTMTQKDGITGIGENVFRNFLTPRMQVDALAAHTVGVLGLKRFAVLYPAESYGQTHMQVFRDAVTAAGGVIVGAEAYQPQQTDFAAAIKRLAGPMRQGPRGPETADGDAAASQEPRANVDAIFIPDAPDKVGLIVPQLAYYDVRDVYLLGTNLWHSDKLIRMAQYNIRDAIIPEGFFDNSATGHVRQFVSGFMATYGHSPEFIEAVSYDTAMMLFSLAGRPDVRGPADIRRELLAMPPFEGVTGRTVFDANREAVKNIYLLQVVEDRFQEVGHPQGTGFFQP